MDFKFTNKLIQSTSPYLLQHAHNPVNWHPWNMDIISMAKSENKLILVSIGYAACHWCHVMEHESFEDVNVANVMNTDFICVKVDREERPDVDHYYMTAVQLMQQQGGWPLNVVALPDGRPIWGGTYFPKETWIHNLQSIAAFYKENKEKTEEYAANLQNGIEQATLTFNFKSESELDFHILENGVNAWKKRFDFENGGRIGAPKFPMPVNLDFLLYYGFVKQDNEVLNFVETTLLKMARGGIYDQIGGGFARYSVDSKWKVPHFEKMLYDNGQLISLYSKAYQHFRNEEFKKVVYETVDFLERELTDETGAFFSSLDADSEGEEGKFYVWNKNELKTIIQDDFDLFADYFNVNSNGFWENGNYILLRNETDEDFVNKKNISLEYIGNKVKEWQNDLLEKRSKRVRPGLDDKTLISWNELTIKGLTDATIAFNDDRFLTMAIRNAEFIKENVLINGEKLFHLWKSGKADVAGFLEDYAFAVDAFISLWGITGNEDWLRISVKLTEYAMKNFYNDETGFFYFSENGNDPAIMNHYQNEDNVTPAANSVMANNLHKLYLILGQPEYLEKAKRMLQHISPNFQRYPMAYSNWGTLLLKLTRPYFEVVILGETADVVLNQMLTGFHPDVLWMFSKTKSEVPVFKDRTLKGITLIYVCEMGVCKLPVENPELALRMINKNFKNSANP